MCSQNLLIAFDKQAEELDLEKERTRNFEHQIGDLAKQLEASSQQVLMRIVHASPFYPFFPNNLSANPISEIYSVFCTPY